MNALAVAVAVAVVGSAVVGAWWTSWWTSRPTILPERHDKQVVVTLKSELAFSGVLWQSDGESFVLRNAEALAGGDAMPVDGELVLLRGDVAYMQFLSEGTPVGVSGGS